MSKKKYYDEDGNRVRSNPNPSKPFYKKWWVALIICSLIFVASYLINKPKDEKTQNENEEETEEISESENIHEKENRASTYTFDDFKGTYIMFADQPFESGGKGRFIISEDYYEYTDFWETSFKFEILDQTIEENILTLIINVGIDEYMNLDGQDYRIEFELEEDNDEKHLKTKPFPFWPSDNEENIYSIDTENLQEHYDQLEIDYARIIMTLFSSELPLDAWAMNQDNPIYISHTKKGETLGGWPTADSYPENVTHIRGHLVYMIRNKSDLIQVDEFDDKEQGILSYAAHGDGNITIYYLNKEGAVRVSQEVIENRGVIFVDPSEPYFVADFIGRVNFIYE